MMARKKSKRNPPIAKRRQDIKRTAEAYRLAQAKKLLELFEGANGRPATTMEELVRWVGSAEGQAALAYDHTPDGKIIPEL